MLKTLSIGLYGGRLAGLLLAPDDGAGSGAGAGDPPAAGGAGDPPAGGDGGNPPAFAAPDFLPEHLRGKDAAETLAKIAPDWKTQRDTLAQRQPAKPETADGYEFAPADNTKQFFKDDPTKDPVIAVMKQVAHKYDMAKDKFAGFMNDTLGELAKAGLIGGDTAGIDYAKEGAALVPEDKRNLPEAEQKALAKARVDTAQTFADTLKARGEIDDSMHQEFSLLLETAAGVRLVEFMASGLTAEKGLVLGGGVSGSGYSMADYNRDAADPRYFSTGAKYDPAFRAEVDAKSKHLFK